MWKTLFCFKREAFAHASKSPFRVSFLFMLTKGSHACRDLIFLTIRQEQPDTKVNETGHPGCISCQQLLQLLNPQKAGWASVNCQAKLREYSEFSWDKLKQIEVDNVFQKGSFSHVAKSSTWLAVKISLLTFANLPVVCKALCFSHCEAVSAQANSTQRKPSSCVCAHFHLCRAFPVLPGSTYTDRL